MFLDKQLWGCQQGMAHPRPADMEVSCEYIEKEVAESRQGVGP